MHWLKTLTLTVLLAASLTACNTMEGFGEDLEEGGDAIEDSAEENKNY